MRIEVRGRGIGLDEATRAEIVRRLLFALGRFEGRLRSVRMRLSDTNGPRGGVDKQVQVAVRFSHGSDVVHVEDSDTDVRAAAARAAARSGRAVARRLLRRTGGRGPLGALGR
jgi:ribosome-associated translation inhibitor RaiA